MTTIQHSEHDLRELLRRRVDGLDENAFTGERIRGYADTRRRHNGFPFASVAAAAAVLALVAGVEATIHPGSGERSTPADSTTSTTVAPTPTSGGFGSVPQCPATIKIPGTANTVCAVGQAPSIPSGSIVIRVPGR